MKIKHKKTKVKENHTVSEDERLSLVANLIIDRMLEDKKNGVLKYTKK